MSDRGRLSLELAVEAAKADQDAFVSFACLNPTMPQAEIFPWNRFARQHPHSGPRPEWSGWCVIEICHCDCHYNEAQDEFKEII